MAIRVKIDTSGIDEFVGEVGEWEARIKDMRPALAGPAERFKSLVDESFRKSKSPDGTAWKPLSPAYAKRKAKKGWSPKPLIRSGARGLQGQTVVQPQKRGLGFGWGPLTYYGEYHQFPRDESRARRFLPFYGAPDDPVLMSGGKIDKAMNTLRNAVVAWIFRGERG